MRKMCQLVLDALTRSDTVASQQPQIVDFLNPRYSDINEKGTLSRYMTAKRNDPIVVAITVEQS